jgi:hypothetical protein
MHTADIVFAREGMQESEIASRLQGIAVSSGGQLVFSTYLLLLIV